MEEINDVLLQHNIRVGFLILLKLEQDLPKCFWVINVEAIDVDLLHQPWAP